MIFDFLFNSRNINKVANQVQHLFVANEYSKVIELVDRFLLDDKNEKTVDIDALGKLLDFKGKAWLSLDKHTLAMPPLLAAESFFKTHHPTELKAIETIDLSLAECYLKNKQHKLAIEKLKNLENGEMVKEVRLVLIKIYPLLGDAYHADKQYEKAIETYEKLLAVYRNRFPDQYLQINAYNQKDKFKEMLKVALEAKKCNYQGAYSGPFLSYQAENGAGGMMDLMTAQFLVSDLSEPNQNDLTEMLTFMTRVEVWKSPLTKEKQRAELSNNQVAALVNCLNILSQDSYGHRLTIGDITFAFYKNNELLAKITHLGGGRIRWEEKWQGDAQLINVPQFDILLQEINDCIE